LRKARIVPLAPDARGNQTISDDWAKPAAEKIELGAQRSYPGFSEADPGSMLRPTSPSPDFAALNPGYWLLALFGPLSACGAYLL
jgi:hypothetical protein